jgi:hypothetical protein
MSFHVIRGKFYVKGYSPDGDSIRFKADVSTHWAQLAGPPVKLNALGHAQLRLEAIDTLETHYEDVHQPMEFAREAMNYLMAQVGITGVQWNPEGTRVTQANDGTAGYIISREVEKNRRPVAFAFAGIPAEADGSAVFLDVTRVEQSVNAEMLRSGLAYPTYYKGLFPDLRAALTAITESARKANRGLWPSDRTNTGFAVTGLQSITEEHVILPKLFRRLASYLEAGGAVQGFKDHLALLAEVVVIISTTHATHFDTVVNVAGNTVRMTEPPENLMFVG